MRNLQATAQVASPARSRRSRAPVRRQLVGNRIASHRYSAKRAAAAWAAVGAPALHLGFNELGFAPDAFSAIENEGQARIEARLLLNRIGQAAYTTRIGLQQNLISAHEAERILNKGGAKGITTLAKRIHTRLIERADAIVAGLGLPSNKGEDLVCVCLEADGVCVESRYYDQVLARTLLDAPPSVRKEFVSALYGTGLPIIMAHDLIEMGYGWCEAASLLPKVENPNDEQLRAAWQQCLEVLDHDIEPDADENGEPAPMIYGIGYYSDFEDKARALCKARTRFGAPSKKADVKAARRWKRIASKLKAITPELRKWKFRDLMEYRDGRPMEETFVVGTSNADAALVSDYFHFTNDNSGETPSVWFDLQDESSLLRATLFPKLASGVMALIATGDKP